MHFNQLINEIKPVNFHNKSIKEEIYTYCNEFLLKRAQYPDNKKNIKLEKNDLEEEFLKLAVSDEEKKTR